MLKFISLPLHPTPIHLFLIFVKNLIETLYFFYSIINNKDYICQLFIILW